METTVGGYWIADLKTMKCCNRINKIVIGFRKQGMDIIGKVTYVPLVLLKEWGAAIDGGRLMQNAVTEGERVFLGAYYESKPEKP